MNRKNSLLLPPQFFENDFDKKIRSILDLGIDALYLFDHFKNPKDSIKPTYIFTEEIFSLYKKVKNEIEVGVCVLNVNARELNILFRDIIDPLLELKNINIGLGTGDNKYEKHDEIFDNDIEVVINYILKNNNFISNNSTLFIGGNSQSKLDLVQKYNLGINQWMGLDSDFIDKQNIYKNLINPIGTLSRCVTNKMIYEFDYEKIFVVKDSNLKIFQETIDNIFKNE
jgi:hypothetical protein